MIAFAGCATKHEGESGFHKVYAPEEQTQPHDLDFLDKAQTAGEILDNHYPQCVKELVSCDADKARIREYNESN